MVEKSGQLIACAVVFHDPDTLPRQRRSRFCFNSLRRSLITFKVTTIVNSHIPLRPLSRRESKFHTKPWITLALRASRRKPADLFIVCYRSASRSVADLQIVFASSTDYLQIIRGMSAECLQNVCRISAKCQQTCRSAICLLNSRQKAD